MSIMWRGEVTMQPCFWIPGEPATFATSKESAWKAEITNSLKDDLVPDCDGISLEFSLSTLAPRGHNLDIDNLCEPVFSVLSKLGWFKSRRTNINWWRATKQCESEPGLRIWPEDSSAPETVNSMRGPDFHGIYDGRLPTDSRDEEFINWVIRQLPVDMPRFLQFIVELRFGGSRVNIGDISTGKVKPIIDCLYPVLGGKLGAPEDWRINDLQVCKRAFMLEEGQIYILIWGSDEEM